MPTPSTAITRRRHGPRDPHIYRNVAIHPELYKQLMKEKADTGEPIYQRVEFYLRLGMKKHKSN